MPVQPSVKISEVNTKQYQKPKKVAVNEADKYNLNQDVTVQDYDIYENQVGWKVFLAAVLERRTGAHIGESKLLFFLFSRTAAPRLSSTRTSSALPKASRSGEKIPLVDPENSNGNPNNSLECEKIIVPLLATRAFIEMSYLFLLQLRSS